MGKYKYKLSQKKKRVSRVYKLSYAPFVTNWSGVYLNKKARNEIKINDIVRMQFNNNYTRYVEIKRINNEYCCGIVWDPYNGHSGFRCNDCMSYCNEFYSCMNGYTDDGNNTCDYHLCTKCADNSKKNINKNINKKMNKNINKIKEFSRGKSRISKKNSNDDNKKNIKNNVNVTYSLDHCGKGMTKFKYPFADGTIITFKKSNISEIPNWTKNTCKIEEHYIDKHNMGRLFTGVFEF